MDVDLLWKAVLIVFGGTLLLRVAGRKSISQMTLAQVVIMIGLGSLLVQPIVGKGVWATLLVGLTLVLTLVFMEFVQIKVDPLEKFITGQSKVVIQNGTLEKQALKKMRLTVDQLEMKLRQSQVSSISDVQYATLEPNGQLGFILKQSKQPAIKEDIVQLRQELEFLTQMINDKFTAASAPVSAYKPVPAQKPTSYTATTSSPHDNIFDEVSNKGHMDEPPNELQ
ncbi:DUF421 domain-containing protein [Rossellomorea vietnamensis]|uniref:DUF421 domain-containing protein n=1 Tax=Rossellomorea vietnamensis TaxID=218284 RepID=A0A5D4MFE6_9BACI|nr:DUF421 domain-containing protein [Rossellomorea vietnamensis]TYS00382.1 DUF421 domain-containing protein [Rossellomorea vietnamensis]